jgi:hypothetical protein
MSYTAPLKDMLFNIEHLARIDQVAALPGFEDAGLDTAQAVLEECARLNEGVIAPLNWEGDKYPSSFHDGKVTTTPGFKEAFKQYAEGGWQGLQHPVDFGGQGLPKTIGAACGEILNSANMSFALCPLLTDGAIEALITAGSDELLDPIAAIPLHILGRPMGLLAIYRLFSQKQRFEPVDYQLFSMLAEHAATALFSATLYGDSERKRATYRGLVDLLLK